MDLTPSLQLFSTWTPDEQKASGFVMIAHVAPANEYLFGRQSTMALKDERRVVRCEDLAHYLIVDESVIVQHTWEDAETPERTAPYGAASFLPLIERSYGPVWRIVSAAPDDLLQSVTRQVIWRRRSEDDPGEWSVDGGMHWNPVTEPVVAVDSPESTRPDDASAEWGIPHGFSYATALERWGWLLYRGDWGSTETAETFHEALRACIAQARSPGMLLFTQRIDDLARRLYGDEPDPVERLEVERNEKGLPVALAAIRTSGARERWKLAWFPPEEPQEQDHGRTNRARR